MTIRLHDSRLARLCAALMMVLVCGLFSVTGVVATARAASGPVLSLSDRLIEADLLFLTRGDDDHLARCAQLLESLRVTHPEAQDEILWRLSRLEKWVGDELEKTGTADQQLVHYKRAEALAKEAVKVNDKCAECHFWLGVAYGKIGQTRGVLQSLFLVSPIEQEMRIVLSLNPQHSGAHHVLGVVYRLIPGFIGGSLNKSIAELVLAIQLNRASTAHYLELARSYAAAGMKEKGLAVLDELDRVTGPYDPTQAKVDHRHAVELRQELVRS
jgi:tetratricopeptide (TPR) repeat protein